MKYYKVAVIQKKILIIYWRQSNKKNSYWLESSEMFKWLHDVLKYQVLCFFM